MGRRRAAPVSQALDGSPASLAKFGRRPMIAAKGAHAPAVLPIGGTLPSSWGGRRGCTPRWPVYAPFRVHILAMQDDEVGRMAPGDENAPERERGASIDELARLVRTERKARDLTQGDFADLAGVGRRFVSDLENGKRTVRLQEVEAVLRVLGLRLSWESDRGSRK